MNRLNPNDELLCFSTPAEVYGNRRKSQQLLSPSAVSPGANGDKLSPNLQPARSRPTSYISTQGNSDIGVEINSANSANQRPQSYLAPQGSNQRPHSYHASQGQESRPQSYAGPQGQEQRPQSFVAIQGQDQPQQYNRHSSQQAGQQFANLNQPNQYNQQPHGHHAYGQQTQPPHGQSSKDTLLKLFNQFDTDQSGRLSADELVHALKNYDKTEFRISVVTKMVKAYDTQELGSVNFQQFVSILNYINNWRRIFEMFDTDNSLHIDRREFINALAYIGYKIDSSCLERIFDKFCDSTPSEGKIMKLDSFIEASYFLLSISEDFRKFPSNDNGFSANVPFTSYIDLFLKYL